MMVQVILHASALTLSITSSLKELLTVFFGQPAMDPVCPSVLNTSDTDLLNRLSQTPPTLIC